MAITGNPVFALFAGLVLLSSVGAAAEPRSWASMQKSGKRGLRKGSNSAKKDDQNAIKRAVDEALGVGHGINEHGLDYIRKSIEPMWRALPKSGGRVDRKSFRFIVQRFFMQRHHLSIVGLEANLNKETESEAALLIKFAPNYVKKVVEGDASKGGFAMEDVVAMIAALRQLVEHSGDQYLEAAYKSRKLDMNADIGREKMLKVMEGYIIHWMLGEDKESVEILDKEKNEKLRETHFEGWALIREFAHGHVRKFEYDRQQRMERNHVNTWNGLRPHFSFADAQAIVGEMALSFGSFWETECMNVKAKLLKYDHKNTGYIKLADFHGAALDGEWRFGESKEYLKDMGALDESSSWQGPRVIATNYLQAPSNCIITTEHYRVCCSNECQGHLDDLEASIGGAAAIPEEILSIVETLHSGLDEAPRLTHSLKSQLRKIAETNGGKVPIHGRLFSQWMHHVFPLDCAFPHKTGTTSTLSHLEFGEARALATKEEMANHTVNLGPTLPAADESEEEWKAQWDHEEELLTELQAASWEVDFSTSALGAMLLAGVYFLLTKVNVIPTGCNKNVLPTAVGGMKSHYV